MILSCANRPAFVEFDDPATKRLRDDLMPETNAHHRHGFGAGAPDEVLQRRDEWQIVISPVLGAGDQPALRFVDACGKVHIDDIPRPEFKSVAGKHALKLIVIVAKLPVGVVEEVASLKDTDKHEAPKGLSGRRLVRRHVPGKRGSHVRRYRGSGP